MPSAFLYIGLMLFVICVWFLAVKRPVYEGVILSFLVLVAATGTWDKLFSFILSGMNTNLLYSMVAFMAMSQMLTKTGILDSCISVILALLGRTHGGAGYVAVVSSAFMGAFSGSGPGNVMAIGTVTIPAMKRSGYSPELAANIQASSSCLGNMIPPSSNIIVALGAYAAIYPDNKITTGSFWLIMWGISFYFIVQRILSVFVFCKKYKIQPMASEDIPDLKETLKNGWKGLLLPIVILVPFLLDAWLNSGFITARLGATGAKYLSSSVLLFTAGIASAYGLVILEDKSHRSVRALAACFSEGVAGLAPTVATTMFGYIIGALFAELGFAEEMEAFILNMSLSKFGMCLVISLVACFLGMVIPGSSITVMFGPLFITALAAAGVPPLLAAAMLPVICGAMGLITPPFALCVYAAMGIAGSDFGKTFKNDLWWVFLQLITQMLVLMGLLPVLGL